MSSRPRAVIAALSLALLVGAAAPARAASGSVTTEIAPEGYARIAFDFDRAPETRAKLVNGVLVISFSEPVEITTQALAKGLADIVAVVRRDPDGTALRMSLTKPVRLVTRPVGERVFVDLLPMSWNALPPPLPDAVLAELTRDAREGRTLKAEEERARRAPKQLLTIEGATHPTFRRLVFKLGGQPTVDWRRDGPDLVVSVTGAYAFDAATSRARMPLEFAGLKTRPTATGIEVVVPAPGKGEARGFREDGDFVLDIDRDDAPPRSRDAGFSLTMPGNAPAHGASPDAHDAPAPPPPAAQAEPEPAPHVAAPAPAPAVEPAKPAVSAQASVVQPTVPTLVTSGGAIRLTVPFAKPTAAAAFLRGRTLWLVFDDPSPLALAGVVEASRGAVTGVEEVAVERGRAFRLKLDAPRLVSAAAEGSAWIFALGDEPLARAAEVALAPGRDRAGDLALIAELPGLGAVRSIADPEVGDELTVATLAPPARAMPVARQFVEVSALPTAQGLALSLGSESARAVASIERLSIEKDGGLALSATAADAAPAGALAPAAAAAVLNAADWEADNAGPYFTREAELSRAAALAPIDRRALARLALARFYQARGMAAESKAVLDAIVDDGGLSQRDVRVAILRAAAEVELGHAAEALKTLSTPNLKQNPEAALWRASAEAGFGRPVQARAALGEGAGVLAGLPPELRARFTALSVDLALRAGAVGEAEAAFEALEVLPAAEGFGAREILKARMQEARGEIDRAADVYQRVARGSDPSAAAEAELRSVALGVRTGKLKDEDAITRLERLTTGWRGDRVEAGALARLIELYGDAGRWREAFSALRVAVEAFPDADDTRALQDRMQERFGELFMGGGADKLSKLDALALFYDFKELSPGGRRGDELVRRFADRLVDVDLLDQAAELLTYQIDHRLAGAARAQVASSAALIMLMNGKPGEALETLRKTRQADLPESLMKGRTRLEARALAETGRTDLALEIAEGLDGPEAQRLKADILWSARRWPEAGEALEATLGTSWRDRGPLDDAQRADVMRAAIAASLAGDAMAVDRIRQKFGPKMAESPLSAGFDVVTAPIEARGDAFREIARSVASSASFDAFLREYRKASAPSGASSRTSANDARAPSAPSRG